ncbi:MAG: penicillin acylase family protein [Ignavibacteriaceae bacterium]
MPRWTKILIGTVSSILILLIVAGFIFYRMLRSSLPEYSGEIKSDKISNEIEIYRDSLAIPYISAANQEDAAFALGFVHAQERMFTMDLARRAAEGRLSEIFGKKTIPFDQMFRTVGIKSSCENILSKMNPASLKILKAYSDGVNLYIKNKRGEYPVEFDILGYQPESWKPINSEEIIRMMGWELNISWWVDISFTELVQKLGVKKVEEILPQYPENGPTIIPSEIKSYPRITSHFIDTDKRFREFMGWSGTHIGSNNWVVDGKKSVSGKPIIANDTHLGYKAPGTWFAAVLQEGAMNVSGFTLPGVPGVVIGKNSDISWAVTNIMNDDADFYLEKLDSTKSKYYYNGEWEKLKSIEDTIYVKNDKPVLIKIYSTDHGPIISDIHPFSFLYKEHPHTPALSMKWMGNDFSDEFTAILGVNNATNWNEFKSALKDFAVPGQNFVYADKEGNIGYVFGSKLPIRNSAGATFVFDGSTDKYDWKGYISQDQIPTLFNPTQDFIASANNKTLKDFKYYISNLWEPTSRIDRIDELLTGKKQQSVSDFQKYQMDFVSPYAKEITKYILDAFQNVKVINNNLRLSLELLRDWNYEMDQYSQVPAIYATFLKHLLKNIYEDEMGTDLYNEFVFVANIPYRSLERVLSNPDCSWFDNINTPQIESENDIIRKSFTDALTELEEKYGKDLTEWQWGDMHKVTFKHSFSGFSGFLDKFINIGPYDIGGDGTTIFNTEYPFYDSIEKYPHFRHSEFQNNLGPAMRYIYDFSNPDEFYMILTTGESGNVMSNHYRDMSQMWLRGGYVKVRTDEMSISGGNKKMLKIIKGEGN